MADAGQTEEKSSWYKSPWVKVLFIFLLGFAVGVGVRHSRSPEKRLELAKRDLQAAREQAAREQAEAREQAAREQAEAWEEQDRQADHVCARAYACEDEIEALAKWGEPEWTTGFLGEPVFSRYRVVDRGTGVVMCQGDRIKFQNGFGVSRNMIYSCTVDMNTKKVLYVSAKPGRLR